MRVRSIFTEQTQQGENSDFIFKNDLLRIILLSQVWKLTILASPLLFVAVLVFVLQAQKRAHSLNEIFLAHFLANSRSHLLITARGLRIFCDYDWSNTP